MTTSRGATVPSTADDHVERLGSLAPAPRWFVVGVMVAGLAVLATTVAHVDIARPALFMQMVALALLTATVKLQLPLSRNVSTLSVSNALTFAAMLLLGTASAVVIGVVSAWGQCTFRIRSRNPWHRTVFSMATLGLSAFAAASVFDWVMNAQVLSAQAGARSSALAAASPLELFRAVMASALIYFAVNSVLVATAVGLTSRQQVHRVWLDGYLWSAPGYFIAAGAGSVVLFADSLSHSWGALFAVPLYLTYRSYQTFIARIEDERAQVRQLSDVQLATIESLALAIEVKDHTSQSHIQRFQIYADGLARAAHLGDDDIRAVKTAALLHDIGNLAVPEHILGKPGALTDEEFRRLQVHPRVGAGIVASVPFPYPVAPLILAHHEHWDGSGYPQGVAGASIPIGARILTAVDFFTALLSDRPYRPARSFGEALAMLRAEAGKSLDPALVETFADILPELEQRVRELHATTLAQRQVVGRAAAAGETALEEIAGTHREAKTLYEIAQVLGSSLGLDDTFGLLTEKLQTLIPYSACALFLREGADGALACVRGLGLTETERWRIGTVTIDQLAGGAAPGTAGSPWPARFTSVLSAPLMLGDEVIGALAVCHTGTRRYGPEDRRLLDLTAQHAAPVVNNSLVFERAQEASLTDPLTGLLNRRALQQELSRALDSSLDTPVRLVVLMLDLDGLKQFNDTFGHHVGDRAIREVGRVMRARLRHDDLCARYAGDEFVVVLRGCDRVEAQARARDLQDAVAAVRIDVRTGESLNLSISVGAAAYPDDGRAQEALIAVADSRMYRDKSRRKAERESDPDRDAA